jgi:glycosyltransferase involved in cell wall biosynthesis
VGPATASVQALEPLPFPLTPRWGRPTLCLVVPVFNEEKVLELSHRRMSTALDSLGVPWQILFVNDGSDDGTLDVLESLHERDPRVSYVVLSRRFGHQAALAAGLDHADADVVVTMDADLQHPPELLGELLDGWRRGYDVVHTRKRCTADLPFHRRVLTRLAYSGVRRVAEVEIIPHASDYRLLDRSVLAALRGLPERGRLLRGLTPWVGFRQGVIEYDAAARAAGRSNYGFGQLARLFTSSLFDFSRLPLHIGLFAGAAASLASFAYVAFLIAAALSGANLPSGYVTLIFGMVFLSSISFLLVGILGAYIARIYDEVRRRPTYLVAHVQRSNEGAGTGGGYSAAFGDSDEELRAVQSTLRS